MEKGKYTEEEIQQALLTDPEAIAFRVRIAKTEQMLGTTYAVRIKNEYEEYIFKKYRS